MRLTACKIDIESESQRAVRLADQQAEIFAEPAASEPEAALDNTAE